MIWRNESSFALRALEAVLATMGNPTRRRLPSAGRRSSALYAVLIVVAGIVCYSNSLSGPFVFDDRNAIVENSSIRSLQSVLSPVPNSPLAGRPLVALSFALNYRVGGLEVHGYHLANIAIHMCTALLLFGVARRTLLMPGLRNLYGARETGLAFAIALLWTVHPLRSCAC